MPMKTLKVEIFDSPGKLTAFVNEKNKNCKRPRIDIQQIICRSIADVGSVYDLFYWEVNPNK